MTFFFVAQKNNHNTHTHAHMSLEDDGLEVTTSDKDTKTVNAASITTKSDAFDASSAVVADAMGDDVNMVAAVIEITDDMDVEAVKKEAAVAVQAAVEKETEIKVVAAKAAEDACAAAKQTEMEAVQKAEDETIEVVKKVEAEVVKAEQKAKAVQEIQMVEEDKPDFVAMSYAGLPNKCVGYFLTGETPQLAVCDKKMDGTCPAHFDSSCTLLTPMKQDVTKGATLMTF